MQKHIHFLLWVLSNPNDKGKEYKTLFLLFVGSEIVGHDENWSVGVQATIGALRFEPIHQQTETSTPSVSCKFWIKTV
jgi:hypothetical protein